MKKRKRSRILRQIKKRELVLTYKQRGCAKCGTHNDLTFHHLNEKNAEISDMISKRGCSLSKLEAELALCIVLCRGCHDKVHGQ